MDFTEVIAVVDAETVVMAITAVALLIVGVHFAIWAFRDLISIFEMSGDK